MNLVAMSKTFEWLGATFIASITLIGGGFMTFQTKTEANLQNDIVKNQLIEIKLEQKEIKVEQKRIHESQIRMEESLKYIVRRIKKLN